MPDEGHQHAGEIARDVSYWRERILRAVLVSTSVFGALAYVPSVYLSIATNYWSLVVADTLAWGIVLFITLKPGLSYRARAISLVALVYGLGLALVATIGLTGAGMLWLTAMPVFAAILLGRGVAIAGILLNTATLVGLGVMVWSGHAEFAPRSVWADAGVAVLVVHAVNGLLLSAALSLAVSALLRGLQDSQHALRREMAERTEAFAERELLQQQLRNAQKLEAIGHLAGGIAHDFNNLLVPILANADELRVRAAPGSNELRALSDIVLSAERARSLVQRVIAFGGRNPVERAPVCVADVVRDAVQLLRPAMPAGVDIVVDLPDAAGLVLADPVELHQIVMNLGTNAGHAMRERGGVLSFSVARVPDDSTLTLGVRDTGTGMTPEVRARAFEPFFTTKPPGEGSGLGLATVYAIANALGASVDVETAPGAGTAITIAFRRAGDQPPVEPEAAPAATASAVAQAGQRWRVMLVDDEPLVLRVCEAMLTRLGYQVLAIGDPVQAASILESSDTRFDALLTDRSMAGMDGLELANRARLARPGLPLVLATGYLDEGAQAETEVLGFAAVVAKPYRAGDLQEALRRALGVDAADR